MKKAIILIAISIFATAVSYGVEPTNTTAYKAGEKLTFAVGYNSKLLKANNMGSVTFTVAADTLDKVPVFRIEAYATVGKFFGWFYKLDDYYYSWLDIEDMKPVKAAAELREGSYRFSSVYDYNWDEMESYNRWRNHKRANESTKTVQLEEGTMDGVALFYTLRSEDLTKFIAGEERVLNLMLEDTVRKIKYKYFGPEEVKVSGLGNVKSLKFSCQLATSQGESFEDGSEFFLWVSDDPNKVPVLLESPIRVGSVKARLTDYRNLKYPHESVLK